MICQENLIYIYYYANKNLFNHISITVKFLSMKLHFFSRYIYHREWTALKLGVIEK